MAVSLAACGGHSAVARNCNVEHPQQTLVYEAVPVPGSPPLGRGTAVAVARICERVRRLGISGVGVRRQGADRVALQLSAPISAAELETISRPQRLEFYDWEPNVDGDPNTPVISLYDAVVEASRQAPRAEPADLPANGPAQGVVTRSGGDQQKVEAYYDRRNDSAGDKYYLFGRDKRIIRPESLVAGASPSVAVGSDARAYFPHPPTTRPPGSRVIRVPRGVVVIQAEKQSSAEAAPSLGYWVMEDDAELSAADVTDPNLNTDPETGEPILTFQFTPAGRRAFARVTKREARRGVQIIRAPGTPVENTFQRFAAALDGQIVVLATVSWQDNPNGIDGRTGAQINNIGNFRSTQELAENLRIGTLPVDLRLVAVTH